MAGPGKKKVWFPLLAVSLLLAVGMLSYQRIRQKNLTDAVEAQEQPKPLPVRVVRAKLAPIRNMVLAQGTARAVRRDYLTFQQPGKVAFIRHNAEGRKLREGDRVFGPKPGEKHGELLAHLDDREILEQIKMAEAALEEARQQEAAARAQLDQARAEQKLAHADLRRQQELYEVSAISRSQLEFYSTRLKSAETGVMSALAQAKAASSSVAAASARINQAQLALERTRIFAPFDGVVTYLNIREGDYFGPEVVSLNSEEALLKTIPIVVIDPGEYELTLELPSYQGLLVARGQAAIVSTDDTAHAAAKDPAASANRIPAQVHSVTPAVSPGGRSVQVKVRTQKGAAGLQDGRFVNCCLIVEQKQDAVVAPFNAFIYRQNKSYVFVADEAEGIAEQREIVDGISGVSSQEILEGVSSGELLVTDGRFHLVNGAPIEIIEIQAE